MLRTDSSSQFSLLAADPLAARL